MVKTSWFSRVSTLVATFTMVCFGFTGMASAQTITNTGANSKNVIKSSVDSSCTVTNNNNISGTSSNDQTATSGNATSNQNTTAGLPWTGWSNLDPSAAQQAGTGYTSWWGSVLSWVTQRATGAGWNSSNSNLAWSPSSSDWSAMDPMIWQQNGQSFANWFSAAQAYMNTNSSNWLLTWPSGADGMGNTEGGASTGNASNFNSSSFSVTINNSLATSAQPLNGCGTRVPTGGSGGGSPSAPGQGGRGAIGGGYLGSSYSPTTRYYGGSGGGSARYYTGSYSPVTKVATVALAQASAPAPAVVVPPASAVVVPVAPLAPAGNSISNTGYNSQNVISATSTSSTTVTNNNNVSAISLNSQTASTGNANSTQNTSDASAGSGNAGNANSGGTGVAIGN